MGLNYNDISLAEGVSGCQDSVGNQPVKRSFDWSRCLACSGGRSCLKCQAGVYVDEQPCRCVGGRGCLRCQRVVCPFVNATRRPVLVPLTYEVAEKCRYRNRLRRNRFYMRCVVGIEVALAAGFVVRAFTLTESDYALGMGLDFGLACKKFFMKMQYDYGIPIPRFVITHRAVGSVRLDRHVICFGTGKLDVLALDSHWHKVYGSKLTGMERVWSPRGLAFYLARYLESGEEKFVKANMSPSWVFPKWWQYNLAYHKAYGEYPTVEHLAGLVKCPVGVRKAEVDSCLSIWGASDGEVRSWKTASVV